MSDTATQAPTAAEIVEIIAELEQYRERLITERMEAAKKAKIAKSVMEAHIAPDLQDIDLRLDALRQLQAQQHG